MMLSVLNKGGKFQRFAGLGITVMLMALTFTEAKAEDAVPSKNFESIAAPAITPAVVPATTDLLGPKNPFNLTVDENVGELIYTFDEHTKKLKTIKGKHGVTFTSDGTTITCDALEYRQDTKELIADGPGLVVQRNIAKYTADKFTWDMTVNEMTLEGNAKISVRKPDGSIEETVGNKISIWFYNGTPRYRIKGNTIEL